MLLMGPHTQLAKDVTVTENCIRRCYWAISVITWLMLIPVSETGLGALREPQEALGEPLFSK